MVRVELPAAVEASWIELHSRLTSYLSAPAAPVGPSGAPRSRAMPPVNWPHEQAARLSARLGDDPVIFETGYGPSGLPHIGTFAEVAR